MRLSKGGPSVVYSLRNRLAMPKALGSATLNGQPVQRASVGVSKKKENEGVQRMSEESINRSQNLT